MGVAQNWCIDFDELRGPASNLGNDSAHSITRNHVYASSSGTSGSTGESELRQAPPRLPVCHPPSHPKLYITTIPEQRLSKIRNLLRCHYQHGGEIRKPTPFDFTSIRYKSCGSTPSTRTPHNFGLHITTHITTATRTGSRSYSGSPKWPGSYNGGGFPGKAEVKR